MEIGRAYLNTLSHNGNDSIKVTFANTMFLHGGRVRICLSFRFLRQSLAMSSKLPSNWQPYSEIAGEHPHIWLKIISKGGMVQQLRVLAALLEIQVWLLAPCYRV